MIKLRDLFKDSRLRISINWEHFLSFQNET